MAKKPSAAELKKEGEEYAKQFAEMRKAQHNFSLQIAKDGLILKTHRRQPAETLWRKGKKEGATNKGAKGICTMSGKVIEAQCDDLGSVPATLAKLAKAYFAERGQPVRFNFIEMTGEPETDEEEASNEEAETTEAQAGAAQEGEEAQGTSASNDDADENAEGEGNASGGEETAPAATTEDLQTSLQREYDELVPKIEAAAESENKGFAKKVAGLNTMFETQIEANPKKARAILGLLQTTIQAGIDAGDMADPADQAASGAEGAPGAGPDPEVVAARRSQIEELERGVDDLLRQFAAG